MILVSRLIQNASERRESPNSPRIDGPLHPADAQAEEVLVALADKPVDPLLFNDHMTRLEMRLAGYHVIALLMSRATQRGIIRHQMDLHESSRPWCSQFKDTIPALFGMPVETADVPFGECRFVL